MSEDAFERLPSAMAREASGRRDKLTRAMARAERRGFRVDADREQVFAILWRRHGSQDEQDERVAWRWFNAWPAVAAGMSPIDRVTPSPGEAAEYVSETYFDQLETEL